MNRTLQDLTRQLLALSKTALDEKVLPQEMCLIQEKAFKIQEELMQLLQEKEDQTSDIHEIQNIFQIREDIWDIMNNLAVRETEVKAKFGIKAKTPKTEHTCCHHHAQGCGCGHHHTECGHKVEKKCCKKEQKICRKK